ncbi:hypothetical protein V8C42DRAFT_167314 [Trichoderma barbatum]
MGKVQGSIPCSSRLFFWHLEQLLTLLFLLVQMFVSITFLDSIKQYQRPLLPVALFPAILFVSGVLSEFNFLTSVCQGV